MDNDEMARQVRADRRTTMLLIAVALCGLAVLIGAVLGTT